MNFFGMGVPEITVILVVALIIFGPGKLPEVAGQVGKAVRDFRRMTADLTGEFERTVGMNDIRKTVEAEITGVKSQVSSVTEGVKRDLGGSKTTTAGTGAKSSTTKTGTAATKSSSSTTAKSTPAKAASTTAPAASKPAVATKKDPLADLAFMDDAPASPEVVNGKSESPATPRPSAASVTKDVTSGSASAEENGSESSDAIARARQRRQAAGYNRRPT